MAAKGESSGVEIAVITPSRDVGNAVLRQLETAAVRDDRPYSVTRRGLGGGAETLLVSGVVAINGLATCLRAMLKYVELRKITSIKVRHTATEDSISIENPRPENVEAIIRQFGTPQAPAQDGGENGELRA